MAGKGSIITDLEILEVVGEGNALGRYNGQVVFVPRAIPGDIVDVRVVKQKPNYLITKIINIKKLSSLRVNPKCEHFGICGGCKWQHLPYEEQLKWKQKQIIDAFERIGKVNIEKIHPILGSEQIFYYRNKIEYTFSNNRWLPMELIQKDEYFQEPGVGFHLEGLFDRVLDIQSCYLQSEPTNELRLALKKFLLENKIPFYDLRHKKGLLRNLIIRNTPEGHFMAILIFGENNEEWITKTLNYVAEKFPNLYSIVYGINTKLNDSSNDLEFKCWKGEPFLYEKIEDLKFRIGPKSFFQTNSLQARRLYTIIRQMARIQPKEIVYDLYTGTGTIALFVAKCAKKVIGIEYVEEAIKDAWVNAEINNIQNAEFFAGDVKDILTPHFIIEKGKPDVLITDPPRAGMHESVIKTILHIAPKRIIYVSCNYSTQARDINILSSKYKLEEIQPVDMFPHTHHVENIACLTKIN